MVEKDERRDDVVVFPNDDSPKLFSNKFLEYLTKTHPAVIFVMYSILAGVFMWYYYNNVSADWINILVFFFIGFFSWTLAEYCMHRWLYHKIKDATYNTGIQYVLHGIHHKHPNDPSRMVLPPVPSLIIAVVFFTIFYLVMGDYSWIFSPGFMIGYSTYMTVHYSTHVIAPPNNFLKFIWNHHNIHHYQQHDKAFGVSTPIWDFVFGTMPKKGRKTVNVIYKKAD